MLVKEIRSKILPVLKFYGVQRAGLFGSAARGEAGTDSDIDILVDIKKDISLLGFIKIKQDLEEKLGRKVDLVEYQTIKPALRKNILKDEIPLL